MPTAPDPYVKTAPGDLITAQLINGMQALIRQDIADQIKKAVDSIKAVDRAGDSAKLGGKTPKELEDEIIQKALAEIPKRTGYQMLFKRLTKDNEKVIEHKLKACPLVEAYELDYFPVICATGEESDDRREAYVNFYLYHSSENRFQAKDGVVFEIEPTDGRHAFGMHFETMLDLYHVPYTDQSSLEDVETEFWKALFQRPNDEFDEDQYCHSPWFEKCCGEQRTVATLKNRGNWNDIMFQMRPRKVIRVPKTPKDAFSDLTPLPSAQADIQVVHYDFDTIGVRLLADPDYPKKPKTSSPPDPLDIFDHLTTAAARKELKVMLLLKV